MNLPMNLMSWIVSLGAWNWFILAAVLFLIEALAPGSFMLWLGLAAILVGAISTAVVWSWQAQLIAFAVFAVAAIPIWRGLQEELPEFDFKMHGSNGEDGGLTGLAKIGDAMRGSSFVFMVKHHGEGYGHVIHNTYCVGRPVIAMRVFYKGKMAEHFLVDDYSAIIIDDKPWPTLLEKIRYWSEPERHAQMCANARGLFEKFVNFDEDEQKFRLFLERVMA